MNEQCKHVLKHDEARRVWFCPEGCGEWREGFPAKPMTLPTPETLRDRVAATTCVKCRSYAINHHLHGRDGSDGDLCDVCYWRMRAALPKLSPETRETLLRLITAEEGDCMRAPMRVLRADYERQMRDVRAELQALP